MAALLLIAVAWTYVVVLMSAAEAFGPGGTWLGAVLTFLGYGVLPLGVVLYIGSTGLRRRARAQVEAELAGARDAGASSVHADPGGGGHPAGAPLPPEREEA